MKTVKGVFMLAATTAIASVAADRSTLSPTQAIIGEWKNATKTYAPNPEYPNSRQCFSSIDSTTKTGIRLLKEPDGKEESAPYSVVNEDKINRSLEIAVHLSDDRRRKVSFTFDDMACKMLQRMYITDTLYVETYHLYAGGDFPRLARADETPKGSGKPHMVRVTVNDVTKTKPVHQKAEIWFRDYGSWWFKPEVKFGATVKDLGTRPSGTEQTLIIYPDSREGNELKVPYMMTDEMNPNGSPRDMISVDISDTEVTVHGLPIKRATGKFELKRKR